MSSPSRKIRFPVPLALGIIIAHPIITFWLMVKLRENGPSPTRDLLLSALFFPSTVFGYVVRLATDKSAAMVFGGFTADFYFGFVLDAVVWSILISAAWLLPRRFLIRGHLTMRWRERRNAVRPHLR
jgi:hypothetical protein